MSTEIHGWRGLALLLTTLIAIGCDSDSNPDVEAPGAVDDLLVVARGDTAAFLTWTARGDDGNDGRAAAYDIRYSLENLTATSFDSAIAILSPPMPGMSGDPDSVVIAGLLPDRTYFFGLRSTDEVGNLSDLSNIDSLRTPASPDTMAADVTPPAAVNDLRVLGATPNSVDLAWTASGDDFAVGRASGYELRYALVPLNEENWSSAAMAPGVPDPGEPGHCVTRPPSPWRSSRTHPVFRETPSTRVPAP